MLHNIRKCSKAAIVIETALGMCPEAVQRCCAIGLFDNIYRFLFRKRFPMVKENALNAALIDLLEFSKGHALGFATSMLRSVLMISCQVSE
jgi:hypothetical protein